TSPTALGSPTAPCPATPNPASSSSSSPARRRDRCSCTSTPSPGPPPGTPGSAPRSPGSSRSSSPAATCTPSPPADPQPGKPRRRERRAAGNQLLVVCVTSRRICRRVNAGSKKFVVPRAEDKKFVVLPPGSGALLDLGGVPLQGAGEHDGRGGHDAAEGEGPGGAGGLRELFGGAGLGGDHRTEGEQGDEHGGAERTGELLQGVEDRGAVA